MQHRIVETNIRREIVNFNTIRRLLPSYGLLCYNTLVSLVIVLEEHQFAVLQD